MNPYDEAEFECEDHFCEICGCVLTYEEWLDGEICYDCMDEVYESSKELFK